MLVRCPRFHERLCRHIISSFQLHDNALELHKYTRSQKVKASHGEGDGFDGELDNFQEPVLSSLAKLVRVHHTMMRLVVMGLPFQDMDDFVKL